jgi:hypothetical protein
MVDPKGEVYVVSKVSNNHHGKFVHLPSSAWGAHHRVPVNEGVYLISNKLIYIEVYV